MRLPHLARLLAVTSVAIAAQLAPAQAADPARSQRFLQEAVQELDDGDVAAAVIQLRNALQQDPANMDARLLLGRIMLQRGDALSAEKELRRVWERRRGDDVEVLLGRALIAAGRAEEAFQVVGMTAAKPEDRQAKALVRADAHLALGQHADARALYESVLAENPRHGQARLALARLLYGLGEREGAEAEVAKLLELEPRSLEGLLTKAEIELATNRAEAARSTLAAAAGIAPDHLGVKLAQARLAIQSNDVPGAETRAREVLARQPENQMAKYLLATAHVANQRFRDADALLAGIQDLVQGYAPAQLLEGIVKFQLEQYAQAERALSRYAQALPHNVGARRMLALTQIRLGNLHTASETLGRLLEDYPGDVPALQLVAGVEMRRGDADAAARAYQRIAESGNPGAARQAQNVLTLLGMGGKAENGGAMDDRLSREVVTIMEQLRTQDHDGALARVRDLRREDPANLLLLNLEGSVLWAKGARAEGRALIEEAYARDPKFLAALDNLDRFDEAEGRPQEIERRMREHLARTPGDERMVLRLAERLAGAKRLGEATELLEDARRRLPASAEVRATLARVHREGGRPAEIAPLAEELALLAIKRPAVNAMAGDAFIAAGDAKRAAEAYARLVEAEPGSLAARLMLARGQLLAGSLPEARRTLEAARRLDPSNAAVAQALVDLALRDGRAADANAYVEALAQHNPAAASRMKAGVALRTGQGDSAVKALERDMAERPSARTAIDLATARARTGKPEAAVEGLRQWLAKAPQDVAVRRHLAELLLAERRHDEAAAEYRALLANDPANPVALNNLAWAEHERGSPEAVRLAERASALAPDSPDIADTLGWILVRTGQVQRGLEVLRKAAQAAGDRPDIQYHLAYALKAAGRPQEARAVLEKVVANERPFSRRQDAEALLAQLRR